MFNLTTCREDTNVVQSYYKWFCPKDSLKTGKVEIKNFIDYSTES